MTVNMHSSTTF